MNTDNYFNVDEEGNCAYMLKKGGVWVRCPDGDIHIADFLDDMADEEEEFVPPTQRVMELSSEEEEDDEEEAEPMRAAQFLADLNPDEQQHKKSRMPSWREKKMSQN